MEIATSTPIAKVSDKFKKNLIINLTLTFNPSSISGSQHCESWYLSKFFPGNQLVDLGDLTSIFSTFPFLIPFFFFPCLAAQLVNDYSKTQINSAKILWHRIHESFRHCHCLNRLFRCEFFSLSPKKRSIVSNFILIFFSPLCFLISYNIFGLPVKRK